MDYDFKIDQGDIVFFFKHYKDAIFTYTSPNVTYSNTMFYNFDTYMFAGGECRLGNLVLAFDWRHDTYPPPDTEYKRWLFNKELNAMLTE